MSLDELRDTFASVSDAVPVPLPDVSAFERRVAAVRRRRTAVRVAGVVAAVAIVAGGSAVAVSLHQGPDSATGPAQQAIERPSWLPVVVGGHLRIVDGTTLGPKGPAVASVVGTSPHGVVVLTEGGTLARIDEQTSELSALVPGTVVRAYLDGDAVVYENANGLIRWRGIEPVVQSSDSAQTDQGLLMAAGAGRYVVGGAVPGALVSHDADGLHELVLDRLVKAVSAVQTAGDVIAVQTDQGPFFFSPDGLHSTAYVGDRVGALSPDGRSYAQQTTSRDAVELLDPETLRTTPVEGPAGPVSDLGWAPDGDLLVVVQTDGSRTLWRCSPAGADCAADVDDPSGTLRLR
jgi:hypothetical protein